jgi:hypothetical protein
MNDEWLPSFAKITQRSEPTLEDDPLQLSANALGLQSKPKVAIADENKGNDSCVAV